MQCTSYNPTYYRTRDLNIGESGFSWHLFHNNANYGKETGHNISLPMSTMDQYLVYDKEVLRQIIQNHEATFRHQVQELHRLYRRQRELTDEMRVREIFRQQLLSESSHLLSQAQAEISATAPYTTTSWLLGDRSQSKMSVQPPDFVAKNFQVPTNLSNDPLTRKNIYNKLESISSRSGGAEKTMLDLELPANMYGDDEFKRKLLEIHPVSNSGAESGSNLNISKANVLIDLNAPVQFESMASSSETCVTEVTILNDLHYLRSPGNKNLPVAIDLNSMPLSCYSETETTITDDGKLLKDKTPIDLNAGIFTDEPSPPPVSTPTTGIRDLKGPRSPENKERLPPRGKSEDSIQLETPPDIIGAETLLMISSSEKFMKSLCWFADIVSSTGDDLENEIMKLSSHAAGCDHNGGNARKGHARATQQHLAVTRSTDHQTGEGFLRTGLAKRNAGKKAFAKKPRNNSKLSRSAGAKKSTSSFKKQLGSYDNHGVLLSWGMARQRQGGRRRRASKSFSVISLLGS